MIVATLLGRAQVAVAALCLPSLVRYGGGGVRLRLHDDGTLTQADVERLESVVGAVEVIWRREADARVEEILAARPAARAFRRANPLALKLIDPVLLGEGEVAAFCDTDVLFLRPFRAQLEPGAGVDAVFMADTQSAYSLRSWQLLAVRGMRLLRRVNTGLYLFRRAAWDPDLVEWFARRPELHRTPVWAEQTCWAMLGARVPARLLDERQVVVPQERSALGPEVVAAHFVAPVRHRLAEIAAAAPDRAGEESVRLRCRPARPCRPHHLLGDELRRRWRRSSGA